MDSSLREERDKGWRPKKHQPHGSGDDSRAEKNQTKHSQVGTKDLELRSDDEDRHPRGRRLCSYKTVSNLL
jgi:hypothetical protein